MSSRIDENRKALKLQLSAYKSKSGLKFFDLVLNGKVLMSNIFVDEDSEGNVSVKMDRWMSNGKYAKKSVSIQ